MQSSVGKYSSAPEVAYSSQPETQRDYGSEGLQYDDYHGFEEKDAHVLSKCVQTSRQLNMKRLLAILCTITALVTLAIGIGIGYAVGNNSSSSTASSGPAKTVTITSTATPPGPTAILTETSTNVDRGIVGIAEFSCSNHTTYSSPYGVKFGRVCNTDYPGGDTVFGSEPAAEETVEDIFQAAAYTFEACMDICAQYNSQRGTETPCKAVTYNANLTVVFKTQPGDSNNCWLKSDRGDGTKDPYYLTIGSAYLIPDQS